MNFKEWFLKEMTSTACVAHFARPSIPLVRRIPKGKVYEQPQVKESQLNPNLVSGSCIPSPKLKSPDISL